MTCRTTHHACECQIKRMDEMEAEAARLRKELEAAVDHCKQKSERISKLEEKSTDTVCAYCGARFQEVGTEQISVHILICERHPLRARLDQAEKEIERLTKMHFVNTHDLVQTEQRARKYEEALSRARAILMDGSAHGVFWREDAIEAINQALDAAGKAEG